MAKSANVYARIEPEIKEQAEMILNALGIPASNAITMFYKQIILQKGLPFDVKLPEQLNMELERGYADMQEERTISAPEVFKEIQRRIIR
jgi:DNA-damage-inducible protein J